MDLHLYLDYGCEQIRFGAQYFAEQLAGTDIHVLLCGSECAPVEPAEGEIVTRILNGVENIFAAEKNKITEINGGYKLCSLPSGGWELLGDSKSGVMYGLMDMAELIRAQGFSGLKTTERKPCIGLRGIKFNLPFEPYGQGDPTDKNIETCTSFDFWRQYIDMLAVNRYNLLSLWCEHPFHMMFRLDAYPETCPYDDIRLSEYQQLFHFIFRHAHARGIRIAVITWNIRLPEFAAKGLGLPESMGNSYPKPIGRAEAKPTERNGIMDGARQAQECVKDYIRECIRTMLMTYPEIDMIGTNCAEEMVDDMYARQAWVEETYLEALKSSGRRIPFIMRTNCGSCALAEEYLEKCPASANFISWKYSYAHMYSAERPQFEKIEKVWENIRHPEKLNVLFTVRNDDFHTLRWGDDDFIRNYLRGIAEKDYARGFYWGSDGYIYGRDFAHKPGGHKVWQYDFEKHWMEFSLLGRLAYDLEADLSWWKAEAVRRYGEHGEELLSALKTASKALPPVNRLHWMDIDVRWHPETLLSMFGFRSVIDTYFTRAMPGVGTVSIRDYARAETAGEKTEGETPADILSALKSIAERLAAVLEEIDGYVLVGAADCLRKDLHFWLAWTQFFICRFTAALELARLEFSGDEKHRETALEYAEKECTHWAEMDEYWGSHYIGYMKARGKMMTGYGLYKEEVMRDQQLVKAFGRVPMEASDVWTRNNIQKA